jgi:predicted MPP superfamily phosphohydrolase
MARAPVWLRVEFLLGFALLFAALYALLYEPFVLVEEAPALPPGRLGATWRGKSLAFLSDLHPLAVGYREQSLAEKVREKNPALVLFAGGFLGGNARAQSALLSSLVKGRAGFAVLRPEEQNDDALRARLKSAGVTVLDNQRVSLAGELAGVELLGVTWPGALPRLLEGRDASQPAIVLAPGLSLLAPFGDALLLEAAQSADDPAVTWGTTRGTWRFSQSNRVRITKAGARRVRLQVAIPGLLVEELRFQKKGAAEVVVSFDKLSGAFLRGRFSLLPGSAFGREGHLLDAGGPAEPVTAAQLAPADYAELSVDLSPGVYEIEVLARTKGQGQGAVWLQVEGGQSPEGKPRYQLGELYPFPSKGAVDLLLAGGTLGGKVLPWTRLAEHLFPTDHPPEYWKYLAGLFDLDGVPLYVTRGVHTPGVPARVLAPPELTMFSW